MFQSRHRVSDWIKKKKKKKKKETKIVNKKIKKKCIKKKKNKSSQKKKRVQNEKKKKKKKKKQEPTICSLQETHLRAKDTYKLKARGWKKIFYVMQMTGKQESQYSYRTK